MPYGAKTIPATAGGIEIVAKNTSRICLLLYNNGSNVIFLGEDNSVTVSNGYPLFPGQEKKLKIDGDADASPLSYRDSIHGIVASGTEDLRYWEMIPIVEYD